MPSRRHRTPLAGSPAGRQVLDRLRSFGCRLPIARITALVEALSPQGLDWQYTPRPDLTHATSFRGVEAAALAAAL